MTKTRLLIVESESGAAGDLEERLKELGFAVVGSADLEDQIIQKIAEKPSGVVGADLPVRSGGDGLAAELVRANRQLKEELEKEIHQRLDELATLNEISQAVNSSLDLEETLTMITHHASRLLGAEATSVALYDSAQGNLWFAAASGMSADFVRGKRLPMGQGIMGWVTQNNQPLLVPDVSQDSRFFGGFDRESGFTTRSILCVPLHTQDSTIGAIEAINKTRGFFGQEDLKLLTALAAPAAIAIQNARFYQAELREHQRAEVLRAANLAFTQRLDLEAVLNALLDYLDQFVPYDRAIILLIEEGSRLVVHGLHAKTPLGPPQGKSADIEQIRSIAIDLDANPIFRAVVMAGESMLIPDTSDYVGWPRERGWQAIGDQENIQSWLGVPLIASGEVIGLCSLDKTQARYFNQEHQRLAELLAFQAAIAIQNARLFEQVQAGRERLQSLSRRLVEVQENERRHIARELHDQAGQALASLMVGLRLLEEGAGRDESTRARVIDLKRTVDSVLDNLHHLAADLRPASLDHLGLVAALRQYAEDFGRQHHLLVQFEAVGFDETRPSPVVETALYRVVQEALTNVIRHAHATRAGVLLERRGDRVIAIVEDNGLGFDPAAIEQTGRLGLLGIRERADMLGGSVVIESAPGSGTTLFVEVPYADSRPDRG